MLYANTYIWNLKKQKTNKQKVMKNLGAGWESRLRPTREWT